MSGAGTYTNARRAYTQSAVLTADPAKLVVLLYQGAIRFIGQAAADIEHGSGARMWPALNKAQAIIDELNWTLDMSQGEISERLRAIYLFCKQHLLEGALKRDPARLKEVAQLLRELCESWERVSAAATAPAA